MFISRISRYVKLFFAKRMDNFECGHRHVQWIIQRTWGINVQCQMLF